MAPCVNKYFGFYFMPIRQAELLAAQRRRVASRFVAMAPGQKKAFLSHSHKDAALAQGLQTALAENGWELYIDWQDHEMPDRPTTETAERIKKAIIGADWFLFLATENSMGSKWCPWEIGYADGKKPINRIAIVPTVDSGGRFHGNEYLGLYQKIDTPSTGGIALYDVKGSGQWVRQI